MSLDPVRDAHPLTVVAPLIGMLVFVVEPALAIDCAKAREPAEVTICADPEVRNCDEAMSNAYEALRRDLAVQEFKTIRATQRAWIAQRNAACGADGRCLLRYCRERLAALTGAPHRTRSDEARTAPSTARRPLSQSQASASEVPLVRNGGVYTVPVQINGAITLDFIVDSGAAEVNIPADVVMTLIRAKTIALSDFLPGATYVLADGTRLEGARFTIRMVRIGDHVIQNVSASIGDVKSQLLLGQSVLERLGRWSLDTRRGVMVLGEPAREQQQGGGLPLLAPAGDRTLPPYLPFPVGARRSEIRAKLGEPTIHKDRGYWHNSTVDRFDAVVPDWLTVSYLYDVETLRVRQSEAVFWNWPSFDGWESIEYLVSTLERMAGRSIGPAARQAIERISKGDSEADFKSGQLRGHLERQDVNRVYLAVWENSFHKR